MNKTNSLFGSTIVIVALFFSNQSLATGLSCRAENGQPVDWFVLYKLPASSSSDGRAYLYRTSIDTINSTWISSSKSIDSLASLPGQTLDPIYSFPDVERLLLMYNDEWPNGTSSETTAHAKGVVAMDGHSGFWLVHSVPRFPPSPAPGVNYTLPVTGLRYGQTMLCLSLGFGQADPIGQQLLFYRPFVYHWTEPNQQWMVPSLSAVARGDHITQPPWFHQTTIVSSNQKKFISFAKASQFGKDLYGDWMADVLRNNLYVESWTNGQGRPMPSLCHNRNFTVLNVKQVRLSDGQIFPSHKDHSKWAVSSRQQDPWVCIADINRMDSQRHRGGGSLCFRQPELWSDLTRAVDQVEGCPLSSVGVGKRKGKKKKRISMQKWHSTKRLTSA